MVNKRGLTVIELLLALGLLMICLTMISSMFVRDVRQTTHINDLNELQYQAQVVNDHLYRLISQSEYFSVYPAENKIKIMIFNASRGYYDSYEIKLKPNGDLIENYNEMAAYIDHMEFVKDSDLNCVRYTFLFKKGKKTFEIENIVYRRNAVN
ncbi:MAG: hypothetical protein JXQ26_02785 [Tissierellales bacterium]|nr:hypothetical protein [Tissierellales bacterium]MBN2826884.1 hypothetical protein [Tissierellales bacterium]